MEIKKGVLFKTFINYKNIGVIHIRDFMQNTSYLIHFLLIIIILGYIIPTLIFQSPSGTDVYSHIYNTLRMVDTNSLFEFYEKSFEKETLFYDYPFGLWFFGSIVAKVTGLSVNEIVYILPLVLSVALIFVYYVYARCFLLSKNDAIMACIFLVSMPLLILSLQQHVPRVFVLVLLTAIIYLSINKPNISTFLITGLLVFSMVFTHTGTYMFLLFFSIAYFILSALIWKRFDRGMYILIVFILFLYVMAVQFFPYIQPQYIDKGRMVLSISSTISNKLGMDLVREMGRIFYDSIFASNNLIYVFFWSCLIFAIGKFSLFIHSKIESLDQKNLLAIPIISDIKNISHGIVTTPFWIGPVHTLLSVFGISKLDSKGKCIVLSLILTSFFPGAMGSEEGTGALREIYYLYLIVPITSVAGFYYVSSFIKNHSFYGMKKLVIPLFFILIFLPLISAPVIGNLYYQPGISGSTSEKVKLNWLSKIGNSDEGATGYGFRERIDLYAEKPTPSIPSGSETRRFIDDLKNTYFSLGAEEFTKDLYSFNVKYIISSERTLKAFEENNGSLRIDSNTNLDKIYSSDKDFSIYDYISAPLISKKRYVRKSGLDFKDNAPEIQYFGSAYQVKNDFYKVRLSESSPQIKYIGTKTKNLLGEGDFSDFIRILWRGEYKDRFVGYNLNELDYSNIYVEDNKITYETIIKDETNSENWATLIVIYTFYEKAISREITTANDWVNSSSDLIMNLAVSSSIFSPTSDFEFNQIGYGDERERVRKIYPSQDSVVLEDKKFNEIYLNKSGTGLFIKYSDSNPYPSRITYRGSTAYEYGGVSIDSRFFLSPSESTTIMQYFSIGEKTTTKKNVEQYTSVSPYIYPDAKIPVILIGNIDERDTDGNSSNIYDKFHDYRVIYNGGITPQNKNSLREEINPVGYVNLYENLIYKDLSSQNEEVKRIRALNVNGILFRSFKYNLDTIKVLSDNNILYAGALTVPSPFLEFYREGLRHPKLAYYHGDKTGVVLIPITLPASSVLRPDFDVENAFSQWKETLDSVIEDEGMAVFMWKTYDIGNPDYMNRVMDLINYSMYKGMNFTTPDSLSTHFKLLQEISTNVTKGTDYVFLNVSNYNQVDAKGITYRIEMPMLNNSCPYTVMNSRISRQDIKYGNCRLYISFDLKAGEQKEVRVEPYITRKKFEMDFSDLYEGSTIIRVRDEEGNQVAGAGVYVDARRLESDQKGDIRLTIRRGFHRIRVEKPGFVSRDYEIEVKGRIYKWI